MTTAAVATKVMSKCMDLYAFESICMCVCVLNHEMMHATVCSKCGRLSISFVVFEITAEINTTITTTNDSENIYIKMLKVGKCGAASAILTMLFITPHRRGLTHFAFNA